MSGISNLARVFGKGLIYIKSLFIAGRRLSRRGSWENSAHQFEKWVRRCPVRGLFPPLRRQPAALIWRHIIFHDRTRNGGLFICLVGRFATTRKV